MSTTPETMARESEPIPPKSEFVAKLENLWSQGRFVCVGLDTDPNKIPQSLTQREGKEFGPYDLVRNLSSERDVLEFNRDIIDATADLALAYKPNSAFYEGQGEGGLWALEETIDYIKRDHPEIPVILDFKRGDIENTNNGYVVSAFDRLGADAVTVHQYVGREAMQPFLDRGDKGVLVLARTSNTGAGEFQDLPVDLTQLSDEYKKRYGHLEALRGITGEDVVPLYQVIAYAAAVNWNGNGNVGLVAGATHPQELRQIRAIVGDVPLLIPGIGAQGGTVEQTVPAGKDSRDQGMIINVSRGIIFASSGADYAEAARAETQRLTDEINKYRLAA